MSMSENTNHLTFTEYESEITGLKLHGYQTLKDLYHVSDCCVPTA